MKGSKAWMDGLEGWAESGVGMLVSFLAQHFIAHTASTQLYTDQGGELSHTCTVKHTHTQAHTKKHFVIVRAFTVSGEQRCGRICISGYYAL